MLETILGTGDRAMNQTEIFAMMQLTFCCRRGEKQRKEVSKKYIK
jgi:hypothetical protein